MAAPVVLRRLAGMMLPGKASRMYWVAPAGAFGSRRVVAGIVNGIEISVGVAGSGEIPGAFERGGNGAGERARGGIAKTFVAGEEEGAVAAVIELGEQDGAAQ